MKTLRFFGMALLAIVMSVNLSSCGDDDQTADLPSVPDGNLGKQKQIASILYRFDSDYAYDTKFYYDSQMRLQKVVCFDYEGKDSIEDEEYEIIYSANGLDFKITSGNYSENTHVVLNADGNAKSFQSKYLDYDQWGTSDCDFTYDDGHFLESASCVYDDGVRLKDNYFWNENNLIKILSDSGLNTSVEYTQIPNDCNLDLNWYLLFANMSSYLREEYPFYLTGLLRKQGTSCTNMLKTCNDKSFSYDLDKEGYITSIKMSNGLTFTIQYN